MRQAGTRGRQEQTELLDPLVVLAADGLETGLVLVVQRLGFAGPVRDRLPPLLRLSLLLLLYLLRRLLPQQVLIRSKQILLM